MSFGGELVDTIIEGLVCLFILCLLWPSPKAAARLLSRWGVDDPTEAELGQALTYLRRRRFWYPWLFIGLPAVFDGSGLLPDHNDDVWWIPAILLVSALLAELFAQRRSPAPVRAAVPLRRGLTDIVPGWALGVLTVAAVGAIVLLGGALAGLGWARHWYPHWSTRVLWFALGAALLTVLLVWVVVGLALRRPAVAELRIDPLLRTRSARVSVGLGIALLCALAGGGQSDLRSLIIVLAGLYLWWVIAGPARRAVPAPA